MVAMTLYHAVASPDDERGWLVRIPGLGANPGDGLPTWARNLADVEPAARDLIAVYLDVAPDSFRLETHIELPASAQHHMELARKLQETAASAQRESAEHRREAARELKSTGLTVRDIGAALGVSHQRAQQLISG